VIAYDGSKSSERAVDEVLRRAWPAGSEVRVVTAVALPLVGPATGIVDAYGPIWQEAHAAARAQAYRRIQAILERFKGRPDLKTSYELRDEPAKPALLDVARTWRADLLVLGSLGTTAMGRAFVGSVCHAMVAHAPCSVEIVRPPRAA
jgi:nucleotide-binding universal stress UspA family protein